MGLEGELIRELDLPLNLQGNSRNGFYPALTDARARCLAQARALPVLSVWCRNRQRLPCCWEERCYVERISS